METIAREPGAAAAGAAAGAAGAAATDDDPGAAGEKNTEKMQMRHECWIDKPDRCENRWSSSVSHSREIHNALRNNRNSEREINLRERYRKLAIGFT